METLGDALPKEIERVQEIIREYESLPKGAGMFTAALMKQDVAKAHKAMIEGDIVGMVAVYHELKEWRL